ncbi:hypothetical protein ABNQ39_20815 [Azospirillum sp. A26]|uniref:hypothetical protein n=1 Tax=Azospirillum sp. A26 TaxID=3160607 RepID=UPI0036700B8E
MSIPGDNSELRVTQPERDDAADLIRSVIVLLRIWGRLTDQAPRAEGIAISVMAATEKR